MCGITGILRTDGAPVEREALVRMVATLRHRGPDEQSVWLEGPIGLGHTRLAILDLEGGTQPVANEDGSVHVTYNGEVYNHHALRAELAGRHTLRSRADTEVLVHLYEEHGPAFVERLHGFFALALWDSSRRRLVLARDGLGKKPLFFAQLPDRVLFGSQLRALLAVWPGSAAPDPVALNEVLALRWVTPPRSGIEGIEALLPGEVVVIEDGRVERRRFWEPPWPPPEDHERPQRVLDEGALVSEFRTRFDAAVEARLESDVPLGLLLSGGLDSTAVLESLTRCSGQPVRTFTVGFSREAESEAEAARATAAHFGADHTEFLLSEDVMLEELERIVGGLDEPFGDPSFLPTALVCETARREVTVCLTGDGGDELFGGYTRYRRAAFPAAGASVALGATRGLQRWVAPRLPHYRFKGWKLARALEDSLRTPDERYVASLVSTDVGLRAGLLGPRAHAALEASGIALDAPERRLAADLDRPGALAARAMALDERHYLPGLILTKADRASMAASLELRSPFLDTDLLEWAATVPVEAKLGREGGKRIVRRALAGRVPAALLERKKRGFGTPLGRWFRRDLGPLVESTLLDSRLAAEGWLDAHAIEQAVHAHRRKMRNLGELLWTLLALELWSRRWLS